MFITYNLNKILNINEIFYSLQGETTNCGFPSLFIRLAGCNLNCSWCDTQYAKTNGKNMSIKEILNIISKYKNNIHHITITGGEPLLQDNILYLIRILLKLKYKIQIETNGSIYLNKIPKSIKKIVDVKTPSSNEEKSFNLENIKYLTKNDEIKFVIQNQYDYIYSKEFIKNNLKNFSGTINLSPVFNKMAPSKLADLILKDKLNVRLNLQIHKIIWKIEPKIY